MASYYIFKTNHLTGKTTNVCGGSHNDEHECSIHRQSYMYGFYDGLVERLGSGNFQFQSGSRPRSFHASVDGKFDVEYFMLLDKEGSDLISEISK